MAEYTRTVYADPDHIETLETATPVAAHVFVDFELRGCPVNQYQLLELVSALLAGRKPNIPTHSVCVECKRRGLPCVLVSQGEAVFGADHPSWLRCHLSGLQPRLLWLLRPDGATQHRVAGELVHRDVAARTAR